MVEREKKVAKGIPSRWPRVVVVGHGGTSAGLSLPTQGCGPGALSSYRCWVGESECAFRDLFRGGDQRALISKAHRLRFGGFCE